LGKSKPGPNSRLRILVQGYIVRGPLGGLAWHHLQYVMGLAALGHDVCFVEDSDDFPGCYDPEREVVDTVPTYGLAFTARVFDRVGLGGRWAYFDAHDAGWIGPAADRMSTLRGEADILLNLSGVNPVREHFEDIPTRVLVDTDPVFTQIRHLTDSGALATTRKHTHFLSFGENFGSSGCTIPDDGFPWAPTRQPVVLDAWPVTPGPPGGPLTTVMQWDSYPAREYGGRHFGMKSRSFQEFEELPGQTSACFELALGSPSAPRERLYGLGWYLRDSREPTRDPWTYQRYIRESKAEFSVAKHGYVASRSGWFSERSAAYLASGRPVIVQNTGFTDWLPPGTPGIYPFQTVDEAAECIETVDRDYARCCRAAREAAAEVFDSRKVLTDLLTIVEGKELQK
jgi:hypothetical protein